MNGPAFTKRACSRLKVEQGAFPQARCSVLGDLKVWVSHFLLFLLLQETEKEIESFEEPIEKANKAFEIILKEDPDSLLSTAMKEKLRKLNNTMKFVKNAAKERRDSLEESLDACRKFWPGLEQLRDTLRDVQGRMDEVQDEPRAEPTAIEEHQREHEVRNSKCYITHAV